jgi:hypothetical protein
VRARTGRATVPGTPVFTEAFGSNKAVTLGWQVSSTGGSPITGYVLTPYRDGVAGSDLAVGSTETSVTVVVTGLVNGSLYTFTVKAKNAVGTGAASPHSRLLLPPSTTLGAFVDQQYRDFAGRPATAAERSAGANNLTSGAAPGSIMMALRRSHDAEIYVDPVTRLYFSYFLRIPDSGGLHHWVGRHRAGVSLTAISDSFATSSEFVKRYGQRTNRQFVDLVYQNVLGRAPDQAGSDYWTAQLDSHARTRGGVMIGFSESSEHKTKSGPSVDVAVTWIDMLLVAPDKASFDSWVTQLTTGGKTVTDLAAALLPTSNYASRFP